MKILNYVNISLNSMVAEIIDALAVMHPTQNTSVKNIYITPHSVTSGISARHLVISCIFIGTIFVKIFC